MRAGDRHSRGRDPARSRRGGRGRDRRRARPARLAARPPLSARRAEPGRGTPHHARARRQLARGATSTHAARARPRRACSSALDGVADRTAAEALRGARRPGARAPTCPRWTTTSSTTTRSWASPSRRSTAPCSARSRASWRTASTTSGWCATGTREHLIPVVADVVRTIDRDAPARRASTRSPGCSTDAARPRHHPLPRAVRRRRSPSGRSSGRASAASLEVVAAPAARLRRAAATSRWTTCPTAAARAW